MKNLESISNQLAVAAKEGKAISPISSDFPDLTADDAYKIQLMNINAKCDAGRTIVGKKIGLTSKAMQDMLGVDQPDYGVLLDDMVIHGDSIERDTLLQPKVEAEIAFVLKQDLIGPGIEVADVLAATDYVSASFEIVDSRIKDWKINLIDTISDNASSGVFVLSEKRVPIDAIDLKTVHMRLYKNGVQVNEGYGSAALGDPAYCVAWLANKMGEYGVPLKKGEVVLSGALSAAVSAEKGDVFKAEFSTLGTVETTFQ
jgi:2-keto-4-pentenoate hydratase